MKKQGSTLWPGLLSLAAVYGVMLYFTALTPWAADDFGYAPACPFSFAAIVHQEWEQYFNWGGRTTAFLIIRALLLSNQYLHIILTPLVFVAILFLTQFLIWGSAWRGKILWWHSPLFFALVWIFTPAFGEAFLWRTGAGVYGWMLFFALLFLSPYRLLLENPSYCPGPGVSGFLLLVSLPAGWSNENLGIVVAMTALAVTVYAWHATGRFPVWAALCGAIAIAGWLCLVLAPGNYIRLMQAEFTDFRTATYLQRLKTYTLFYLEAQIKFFPLTCIIMAGAWIALRTELWRDAAFIAAIALWVMAQFTLGAFLFSVTPPDRALTATAVLLCAGAAFFLITPALPRPLCHAAITLLFVWCAISLADNVLLFRTNAAITAERLRLFSQTSSPVIPPYQTSNKYFFIGGNILDLVELDEAPAILNVTSIRLAAVPVHEQRVATINGTPFTLTLNSRGRLIIHTADPALEDKNFCIYYAPKADSIKEMVRALLRWTRKAENLPEAAPAAQLATFYKPQENIRNNSETRLFAPLTSLADITYLGISGSGCGSALYHKVHFH